MPRLLFITERFPPDIGGLAASSLRIASSLARLSIDVDVFAWSRHVPAGRFVEQTLAENLPANLKVYRQGLYRQWDMTMQSTMSVLEWFNQQHKYDVVWGHYLQAASFLAVWFAELHGIKSTVSARGNDIDSDIFPGGDLSRLLWTLNRAGSVTAVSADIAKKIKVLSGKPNVEILPNVVDTTVFNATNEHSETLKSALGIQSGEIVLGFSGELRQKKGIEFLLDALRQVRSHTPCCLLVIGDARANQQTEIQLYAAEHPQDFERLIITGHLPDAAAVAAHLSVCDFYLQPSIAEGMPNALLEAMSCSRVCIASDAGGIPEVIKHGENGFILPRAQLNHLGTAVIEAIELDSETRTRISAGARATIETSYSLAQESLQLERFIGELLSSSSYESNSNLPV